MLVLDEPTAGLDDAGVDIVEHVVADQRALGRTVIAISHDRAFVAGSFPRAVRLEHGRVVADGPPAVGPRGVPRAEPPGDLTPHRAPRLRCMPSQRGRDVARRVVLPPAQGGSYR